MPAGANLSNGFAVVGNLDQILIQHAGIGEELADSLARLDTRSFSRRKLVEISLPFADSEERTGLRQPVDVNHLGA